MFRCSGLRMTALPSWTHLLLWIPLTLAASNQMHESAAMVRDWTYVVCGLFSVATILKCELRNVNWLLACSIDAPTIMQKFSDDTTGRLSLTDVTGLTSNTSHCRSSTKGGRSFLIFHFFKNTKMSITFEVSPEIHRVVQISSWGDDQCDKPMWF